MAHFIALIHKQPDSGYGVSFPDVPGITAVADSLDDAIREGSVVLGFAFEDWPGEHPVPRTLDELQSDPDYRDLAADAVVAAIAPAGPAAAAA